MTLSRWQQQHSQQQRWLLLVAALEAEVELLVRTLLSKVVLVAVALATKAATLTLAAVMMQLVVAPLAVAT